MIRRAIPHLSILALIAALVAVSWQALRVLDRAEQPAVSKQHTADRVLAYRVTAQRGPHFLLDGGRPRLKLSSLGVVSGLDAYDPAIQRTYRLALSVTLGDRELWRTDIAITSRQSKADWDGRTWAREAAWSLDRRQLDDERTTIVELPELPVDAILELRLIGEGEALVRVYQADTRDAKARDRAAVQWDEQSKAELLRSSTYVPWSLLEPMERERRLTRRWQRLFALGAAGVDFETRSVFVSDFRLPQAAVDAEGIELVRGRAAAVNVRGPVRVAILPAPGAMVPFRVETVGTAPRVLSSPGSALAIDVPEGPHSVILSTDSATRTTVSAHADRDHWIAPIERQAVTASGQIVPDRVRIPMVVLGVNAVATLPIYKVAEAGLLGSLVRVDARLIHRAGTVPETGPVQATIGVTFRSIDGTAIGHDSFPISSSGTARFDRLEWEGATAEIADVASFRVIAPASAARLELTADRDVAVSLFRWLPGKVLRKPPYTDAPGPALDWRYAPLLHRIWYPVAPENYEQLARAHRAAMLEAQVRIDASDAERRASAGEVSSLGATRSYETVKVAGAERQRGREPVALDDVDELVRDWEPKALTELTSSRPRTLDFRAALPTRPRLSWVAPSGALDATVQVTIGGLPRPVRLEGLVGSADLPDIPPGQHRVVIDAPADVQLWINRPPVGDHRGVFRDRTLYAIDRQPLSVKIPQVAGEQIHLHAVIYAPPTATARIKISVDGGHPARRVGVVERVSLAESITEITAAPAATPEARLIDLGGRSAGAPRVVQFGLLDDLTACQHRVDVAVLSGPPMWIRLFVRRELRSARLPAAALVTPRPDPAAPQRTPPASSPSPICPQGPR
jgi:hypothetical protein